VAKIVFTLLQVLSSSDKGGTIILMTDGEESGLTNVNDVMPQLIEAKVQIISIAYG